MTESCWEATKDAVRAGWEATRAVGTGGLDCTKSVLNTAGGTIRHVTDSALTGVGQASKDLGNYSVDVAQECYKAGDIGANNVYVGGGQIAHRCIDGIEWLGKGCGNMVGGSIDGFATGLGYGAKKQTSPYPKSIYAPGQDKMGTLPAGTPMYGSQVDSELSFTERAADIVCDELCKI